MTEIGKKLRDQGLIHSTVVFKFITRIIGKGGQLKSGDYSINGRQSLMEIIYKLDKGVGVLVTLREGLRMSEIFKILEENGIGKIKAYETLSRDQKFISTFKLYHKLKNLEGFLFPETYYFSKKDNEKNVLRKIIMTFKKKLPEFFSKKSKKVGLTSYEAIILASIIEKETGVAKERKLISSVFHNRLKKKMRLETDPSVIYGIKSFDGNLTRWHLRKKTPYNTYRIKGLPPTPIANPGLASILAALSPQGSNFLFFVAKGNGDHQFSVKYKDHLKAVDYYQKRHRNRKNYKSY